MDNNIWWAWAIKNSICVICWVVLAIVFHKWWIALFGLLFMCSLKTEPIHYYYRICDKCGEHSESAETYDKALEKAKQSGWVHFDDDNKDYCPNCRD